MGLISCGLTDIGKKRKTNQDAIYLSDKFHFYLVADGMGGHRGGDIASQMAVKLIPEYLLPKLTQSPAEDQVRKYMQEAIDFTNSEIYKMSQANEQLRGMGTTVVFLLFYKTTLFIGNIGDSRAYLINNKQLFQLTRDHSLIQEKLNMGLYNRAQAAADSAKNVLVRTLGFEEKVPLDVFSYKVHRGDTFLLCSDGLHGKVSDNDMIHIVNQYLPDTSPGAAHKDHVDKATQTLVDKANSNGGQDNISTILVLAN